MTKPTIVTRAGKGSALTWTEGDTNLTNLRDATIGISANGTNGSLNLNDTLTLTGTGATSVSYNSGTKTITVNSTGGSLSSDTTPQLGGDLKVDGYKIKATTGNIELDPGSGRVVLAGTTWPAGSSSITGTVTSIDTGRNPNLLYLSNIGSASYGTLITFTGSQVVSAGLTVGTTYKVNAVVNGTGVELTLQSGGGTLSFNDIGTITSFSYSMTANSSVISGSVLTYGSNGSLSWTLPSTSITSGQINSALGYTPYNGSSNNMGFALASSLSAVATSGSYNDLTNKPSGSGGTTFGFLSNVPFGSYVDFTSDFNYPSGTTQITTNAYWEYFDFTQSSSASTFKAGKFEVLLSNNLFTLTGNDSLKFSSTGTFLVHIDVQGKCPDNSNSMHYRIRKNGNSIYDSGDAGGFFFGAVSGGTREVYSMKLPIHVTSTNDVYQFGFYSDGYGSNHWVSDVFHNIEIVKLS